MTTEMHADLAPLAGDNSLPDLAARIRAEHEAVSAALKESVRECLYVFGSRLRLPPRRRNSPHL